MKSFRNNIISIAALALISTAAFAGKGGEGGNTGCNGVGNPNSPCQGTGGTTNNGGTGGSATAAALSSSTAIAAAQANAAAIAAQQQGQQQGQLQGQAQQIRDSGNSTAAATGGTSSATGGAATAEGGAGGSATGIGSGNKTAVNVDASTRVERSAPAVAVGSTTQPIIDCRRTIALGGSNSNGSVVGTGIPLWKEGDCSGMMGIDAMNKAPSGTFAIDDYQQVACTIEVISTTKTCELRRQRKNSEKTASIGLYGN